MNHLLTLAITFLVSSGPSLFTTRVYGSQADGIQTTALKLLERSKSRYAQARTCELDVQTRTQGGPASLREQRYLIRYRAPDHLYIKTLAGIGKGSETLTTPKGTAEWNGQAGQFRFWPEPAWPYSLGAEVQRRFAFIHDQVGLTLPGTVTRITPERRQGQQTLHIFSTWTLSPTQEQVVSEWWIRKDSGAVVERRLKAPSQFLALDVPPGQWDRTWVVVGEKHDVSLPVAAFDVRRE